MGCCVDDDSLVCLARCSALRSLSLRLCTVSEDGIVRLVQRCSTLDALHVDGCAGRVGDGLLHCLAVRPTPMRELTLRGGSCSDSALGAVVGAAALTQLNLANMMLTPVLLLSNAAACGMLRELVVEYCGEWGVQMDAWLAVCPKLERLTIRHSGSLPTSMYKELLKHNPGKREWLSVNI